MYIRMWLYCPGNEYYNREKISISDSVKAVVRLDNCKEQLQLFCEIDYIIMFKTHRSLFFFFFTREFLMR